MAAPAFSRMMPSIWMRPLPRCSLKAGSSLQTVVLWPTTSTTSPMSAPSWRMSAGSMRASPRPTSLPVDSLTFKVSSKVAVEESDMFDASPAYL